MEIGSLSEVLEGIELGGVGVKTDKDCRSQVRLAEGAVYSRKSPLMRLEGRAGVIISRVRNRISVAVEEKG